MNAATFADARKALTENLELLERLRQSGDNTNLQLLTRFTQALLALSDASEHEFRAVRAQLNVLAQRH